MHSPAPAPGISGLRKHVSAHPRTPLVVRYASALIDAGEYETALALCRAAFDDFSAYPTLHLMYAKAQIPMQQFGEARARLQRLIAEYPACFAAQRLLNRIERLERQSLLEGGKDNKGIPEADLALPEISERQKKANWSWREHLIPGEDAILSKRARDFEMDEAGMRLPTPQPSTDPPPTSSTAQEPGSEERSEEKSGLSAATKPVSSPAPTPPRPRGSADSDLERLAGELDSASMPRITQAGSGEDSGPEFEPVNLESRPVTETLAEIYVKQGKLSEAIDAYRKLREMNRDKRYAYTVRISEIKRLIGDEPE